MVIGRDNTNYSTKSIKVDFSDGVLVASLIHCCNVRPGLISWVVCIDLQSYIQYLGEDIRKEIDQNYSLYMYWTFIANI